MNIEDKQIMKAIESAVTYLIASEEEHYLDNPSDDHIFNSALLLHKWLTGQKKLGT